jgi:SAM-dependent methyltransferase
MTMQTDELSALKAQLETTWTTGDYGRIAHGMQASAEAFLADQAPAPGTRVLDVACGTGQLAIPAARAGARATGLDLAPAWIAQAKARAAAEGVSAAFDVGDAEALPYPDASFDLVVSLIGAMFCPRPERVTAELLRVCRPGGRVVLGNWTAEGRIGALFRLLAGYVPPPAGMPSPLLWGDPDTVRARFARHGLDPALRRRHLQFRYDLPPTATADHYLTHFGPLVRAAERLDAANRAALRADLAAFWTRHNTATDGGTELAGEILEVTAVRP